jgi:hypothetical protein
MVAEYLANSLMGQGLLVRMRLRLSDSDHLEVSHGDLGLIPIEENFLLCGFC